MNIGFQNSLIRRILVAVLLSGPFFVGTAMAQDDDGDGIFNYIDDTPSVSNYPFVFLGTNYTLKLHSDRLAVLHVDPSIYNPMTGGTSSPYMRTLTKMVYNHFDDAFDILIFCTDQDSVPPGATYGTSFPVKNDIQGLGKSIYDNSADYGTTGRLQSAIALTAVSGLPSGPSLHEISHRWANSFASIPTAYGGHWGYCSIGGQLGGWKSGTLQDLGGGLYYADGPDGNPGFGPNANGGNGIPYSDFELYAMGLIPTNGLPDIKVANNFYWNAYPNSFGASSIQTITMAEVVATDGARIPGAGSAPTNFRVMNIILANSNTPPDNARLATLDENVYKFALPGDEGSSLYNFWEATGGRGILTMDNLSHDLGPIDDPDYHLGLTGSPTPIVGFDNTYRFDPITNATGYRLQIQETSTNAWLEGAEPSPIPNIIDGTIPDYDLLSTASAATGTRSFHTTRINGSSAQSFIIDREIILATNSVLSFAHQFRYVYSDSFMSAQIASVGSASWDGIWTRFGDTGIDIDGGATWHNTNISLSAYAGETVRIRFTFDSIGMFYVGTDPWIGTYIDDITIAPCELVVSNSIVDLGGSISNFTFSPVSPNDFRLSLQVLVDYLEYTYGSISLATATTNIPVIDIQDLRMTGGQAECDFQVGNGWLPDFHLLSSTTLTNWTRVGTATLTDLGNGHYRAALPIPAESNMFYRINGLP